MNSITFYISKVMRRILRIPAIRESIIDRTAKICSGSNINYTELGKYSYIGNDCYTYHANIGRYCSIGDSCKIGAPSHPVEWVSTSPVFYKGKNILHKNFTSVPYSFTKKTIIGNDVWIGAGAYIKSGVTIGTGAVIGMGAVVTKDVGEFEIWAGNPARFIRKRFDDDIIVGLLKTSWWLLEDDELISKVENISDVEKFIDSFFA